MSHTHTHTEPALACKDELALTSWPSCLRYDTRNLLGQGSFGSVYIGDRTGEQVAVKVISFQGIAERDRTELVKNTDKELRMMKHFEHPNIIHLIASSTNNSQMVIVMDIKEGGSLEDVNDQAKEQRGPVITAAMRRSWMMQLCSGLIYLHDKGVIHRDLKSANVFFNRALTQLCIGEFFTSSVLTLIDPSRRPCLPPPPPSPPSPPPPPSPLTKPPRRQQVTSALLPLMRRTSSPWFPFKHPRAGPTREA